mgnify:CR=1 FL=1
MSKTIKPLVSIIMNCFNGEKYLLEAINSVYLQSYDNWEIIFWDNASNDNSPSIAKSFDRKLKYYKSERLVPLYEARNYAIDKCSGPIICFIDCDDLWAYNKLEQQVQLYDLGNAIVYSRFEFIDNKGDKLETASPNPIAGKITREILANNPISISSILLDANIIKNEKFNKFYNLLGDFELWFRLSMKYDFSYVDEVHEFSRQHGDNTSVIEKNNWILEQRYFYSKLLFSKKIMYKIGLYVILKYVIKCELISIVGKFKKFLHRGIN